VYEEADVEGGSSGEKHEGQMLEDHNEINDQFLLNEEPRVLSGNNPSINNEDPNDDEYSQDDLHETNLASLSVNDE